VYHKNIMGCLSVPDWLVVRLIVSFLLCDAVVELWRKCIKPVKTSQILAENSFSQ